jgi:5-methylcytosine-specific restriction protein B
MPLTKLKVEEAINFLRALSVDIYRATNDNHYLAELINRISPDGRQSLQLQYRSYTSKVNGLRNEVATILVNNNLSYEQLGDLVEKAEAKNPRAYKTIYNNWYSIFYPFLLEDSKDEMDEAINTLVAFLEENLNAPNVLKVKIVDFTGARNNGATRSWIALYNTSHNKQSTAKQLFLEIENGIFSYSLYDRPNEQKKDEKSISLNEEVSTEDVVEHFLELLPEILEDIVPISAMEIIRLLPDEQIFKVSMGQDHFSDEDFKTMLERGTMVMHEETKPMGQTYTSQAEYFDEVMKEGDYVYVCHGNKKVAALAKVTSDTAPCDYKKWGEEGWMQRKIEIIKNAIKQEPYNGPQKWWTPNNRSTCYPISRDETDLANDYLFRPLFNISFQKAAVKKITDNSEFNFPLNVILYGPPGTGKTYNTVTYALSIIEERSYEDIEQESLQDRQSLLDRFDLHKKNGLIEFITFHQNYSYEEFIQGIRPQLNTAAQLQFEKKDGLFKRFADSAMKNFEASTGSQVSIKPRFEDVFDEFFKPLINETSRIRIPMESAGYSFELTKYNPEQRNFSFVKQSGGDGHTLYIPTLKLFFEQPDTDQGLKYYYKPLAKKMLEKAAEMANNATPESRKKYVLIIDEINRANISKVFGELITLIEKDKRWGNKEGTKIILPSGDEFTVPNNVYIIGTMNTADRSIALLDIALRRRFEFKPLYPIYDEAQWWGSLLKNLNEAIFEKRGNPDFFIGHAFFINKLESEKISILKSTIMPLLNEYFQDNGKTTLHILQKAGINCRKGSITENFQIIIEA